MKILDYFYYTFYNLILNFKANDVPDYTASSFLCLIFYLNFISLSKNLGESFISSNKFINLIIFSGFMVPLYLIFIKSDRYKRIVEMYKNESETNKIIRNVIVWGYFIFSFIWLFKSFGFI